MRTLGITERYFPELHALIGVPQDPKWHPEGDVWVHTMLSLDSMARGWKMEDGRWRMKKEKERLKLLFAVLCHDFGKPLTTTIEFENEEILEWNTSQRLTLNAERFVRIRALGHEQAGIEPTRTFLYRLTNEHDFIESILPLVEHHLKPSQFYKQGAKAAAIRRLAMKVNIEELVLVAEADFLGRTTEEVKRGVYAAGEWLLEKARALKVENRPLACLVQGRDLIALGLKPSPEFKMILNDVYALQLEGRFENKEEALSYIGERYIPLQTKTQIPK
jgi:tRNA nucleotidyltransferase (CCA-adding enzyme)